MDMSLVEWDSLNVESVRESEVVLAAIPGLYRKKSASRLPYFLVWS
jgi:hypothetical protein